jgi:hypothetical protein
MGTIRRMGAYFCFADEGISVFFFFFSTYGLSVWLLSLCTVLFGKISRPAYSMVTEMWAARVISIQSRMDVDAIMVVGDSVRGALSLF